MTYTGAARPPGGEPGRTGEGRRGRSVASSVADEFDRWREVWRRVPPWPEERAFLVDVDYGRYEPPYDVHALGLDCGHGPDCPARTGVAV